MTFEELLKLSADDWEKLPDEELEKILRPFFLVTRPTKAIATPKDATTKTVGKKSFAGLQNELFTLATQMGIKLPTGPKK